jgi:excinuclease ABC subunit A
MQFLSDLWLTCEECDGKRYQPEVLLVLFRGKSIADVLAMSIEEAREFFEAQPGIKRILQTLMDVGLGYMSLGQSSTTLSGGEAQRIKLASELWRADSSAGAQQRSVVILDEPSTGLAATDVEDLARCLGRLARQGSAVLVIEHHTELLEVCDRLVELGPEGGSMGGHIVSKGTPLELARDKESITGPWLYRAPNGTRRWPDGVEKSEVLKPAPRAARADTQKKTQKKTEGKTAKKTASRKVPTRKKTTKKAPSSGRSAKGHSSGGGKA